MMEIKVERKQTLREWREEFGLSQGELSELAGIPRTSLSNLETGRRGLTGPNARRVFAALGVQELQVVPEVFVEADKIDTSWWPDGFAPTAPRETLRWWREQRCLSRAQLCELTGIAHSHLQRLERGIYKRVTPTTRSKFARALQVSPDKLVFPADEATVQQQQRSEDVLRQDLRGARRALRKAHDFMVDDAAITFRYQERRDALLPDIQRELRGT